MYQNQTILLTKSNKALAELFESMSSRNSSAVIHNPGSSLSEYFEMQESFMFIHERFSVATNTLTYTEQVMGQYRKEEICFDNLAEVEKRPLHRHSFYEILFVLSGEVEHLFENRSTVYLAGDCVVMNTNICHSEVFSRDFEVLFLAVSDELVAKIINSDIRIAPIGLARCNSNSVYFLIEQNHNNRFHVKEYIEFLSVKRGTFPDKVMAILNAMTTESLLLEAGSSMILHGLIARLFSTLDDTRLYDRTTFTVQGTAEEALCIKIQYLIEKYNGKISRIELNKELNYSPDYMNRVFKKYYGISIKQYSRKYLLHQVADILLISNESVIDILADIGISNRNDFYAQFQAEYHMTPSEYRLSFQKKQSSLITPL